MFRVNPVEIYLIAKDAGLLLHKYSILGFEEDDRDQLKSGFLVALNNFAKDIDFPAGVSLIRSGSLEARFSAGEQVLGVLIIDYEIPLGSSTESVLSGLANEVVQAFEKHYGAQLAEQAQTQKYDPDPFADFGPTIDRIIDKFGRESNELYAKLVLIEAMYAKVPQKWCLPLIERLGMGEPVDIVEGIPDTYHRGLRKAVQKVNRESKPVWEIFVVPTIDPAEI